MARATKSTKRGSLWSELNSGSFSIPKLTNARWQPVVHSLAQQRKRLLALATSHEECFGWLKTLAPLGKVRHREVCKVHWIFTLACAAYNILAYETWPPQLTTSRSSTSFFCFSVHSVQQWLESHNSVLLYAETRSRFPEILENSENS